MEPKYKRVLLKLSGEALAGENKTGISPEVLNDITEQVKELKDLGVEVAVVVGGGNFWRGRNGHDLERTTSDYMGMLATAMNGLALQDSLEARGIYTRKYADYMGKEAFLGTVSEAMEKGYVLDGMLKSVKNGDPLIGEQLKKSQDKTILIIKDAVQVRTYNDVQYLSMNASITKEGFVDAQTKDELKYIIIK